MYRKVTVSFTLVSDKLLSLVPVYCQAIRTGCQKVRRSSGYNELSHLQRT